MQKQKLIALWMYRNDGGDDIQERLKKSLEKKGATVINDFDMRECYCLKGRVYTKNGFDLSSVDVLYHMNADEQSAYQSDILRALELSGVKVINSWNSYNLARNKFWTNVLLKKHGINVPPSLFVNSKQALDLAETIFNKWKSILVKPLSRHGGYGIVKFDELEQFRDFVEATQNFGNYYIEKFIDFEEHDYRVEVFNGKIMCSYCRAKQHSYKTNVKHGGCFSPIIFTEYIQSIALKSAKVLNIKSTIIDLIESKDDKEIYVLEVNPVMGIFGGAFISFENRGKFFQEQKGAKSDQIKLKNDELKLKLLSEYLLLE